MLAATVGRCVRKEQRVAAVDSRWRRQGGEEGGVLRY